MQAKNRLWYEHWLGGWVGKQWLGQMDCVLFVRNVMWKEFDLALSLPAAADGKAPPMAPDAIKAAATVRARDQQVTDIKGDFVRVRAAGEHPQDGDCVIMCTAGRRTGVGHHIGLFACVNNDEYVLHYVAGVGVHLHPLRNLRACGWHCTGVYKWLAR